jgi:hypothetical protein
MTQKCRRRSVDEENIRLTLTKRPDLALFRQGILPSAGIGVRVSAQMAIPYLWRIQDGCTRAFTLEKPAAIRSGFAYITAFSTTGSTRPNEPCELTQVLKETASPQLGNHTVRDQKEERAIRRLGFV